MRRTTFVLALVVLAYGTYPCLTLEDRLFNVIRTTNRDGPEPRQRLKDELNVIMPQFQPSDSHAPDAWGVAASSRRMLFDHLVDTIIMWAHLVAFFENDDENATKLGTSMARDRIDNLLFQSIEPDPSKGPVVLRIKVRDPTLKLGSISRSADSPRTLAASDSAVRLLYSGWARPSSGSPRPMPIKEVPEWADANHKEIDYTKPIFRQLHVEGYQFRGFWAIRHGRSVFDNSPEVITMNVFDYYAEAQSISVDHATLVISCKDGETRFLYSLNEYLVPSYSSWGSKVMYRIDQRTAKEVIWSQTTTNLATGLFGKEAIQFILELQSAEKLSIRVWEGNGKNHDSTFDLTGIWNAAKSVSEACSWDLNSIPAAKSG